MTGLDSVITLADEGFYTQLTSAFRTVATHIQNFNSTLSLLTARMPGTQRVEVEVAEVRDATAPLEKRFEALENGLLSQRIRYEQLAEVKRASMEKDKHLQELTIEVSHLRRALKFGD